MPTAKAICLTVSPALASQLSFEIGGILGESNVELGSQVNAFDFASFYATLGSLPTFQGRPANLLFDFLEIQSALKPVALMALRAETAKAALHKAINARANAYHAKYSDIPGIVSKTNEYYGLRNPDSKPRRLEVLRSIAEQQVEKLRDSYVADGRTGVVKSAESQAETNTLSKDISISSAGTFGEQPPPQKIPTVRFFWQNDGLEHVTNYQIDTKFQNSIFHGHTQQSQKVVTTDYAYRIPFLESAAQNHRAQMGLMDEQFAQFMSGQNIPHLGEVLQNELNSIDMDVFQLQMAYLNTILMSSFAGTVTAIYKYPGDAVKAGEPVLRLEDDSSVYVVGSLIYADRIKTGSSIFFRSALFDVSGSPTVVAGSIVGVRGQDQNDRWSVVAKCNNIDDQGDRILPLGYSFDCNNTQIKIA